MTDIDYEKYYKILEIEGGASLEEIERAYRHLKKLYSADSLITLPISEEFSTQEKQDILNQVEGAYQALCQVLKMAQESDQSTIYEADTLPETVLEPQSPHLERPPEEEKEEPEPVIEIVEPAEEGSLLKERREGLKLSLDEVARAIDIPPEILENIEKHDYERLPEPGHLRWCVVTYARHLGLDPHETAAVYMSRYRQWKKDHV
jgi:hypothetical protein